MAISEASDVFESENRVGFAIEWLSVIEMRKERPSMGLPRTLYTQEKGKQEPAGCGRFSIRRTKVFVRCLSGPQISSMSAMTKRLEGHQASALRDHQHQHHQQRNSTASPINPEIMPQRQGPYCEGSKSAFDPNLLFATWEDDCLTQNNYDFGYTIIKIFNLAPTDNYVYRAMAATNLRQAQAAIDAGNKNGLHAWYRDDGDNEVFHYFFPSPNLPCP